MAGRQDHAPERSPVEASEAATGHSGRLLVRMPATLHAELARVARREGVSLNALVVGALSGAVGWRSAETRTPSGEGLGPAPHAAVSTAPPTAATPPAAAAPLAAVAPHAVVVPHAPVAPPAGAAPSRTLSVALAVNLVVVLLAAAAAIGLVIAAWPS